MPSALNTVPTVIARILRSNGSQAGAAQHFPERRDALLVWEQLAIGITRVGHRAKLKGLLPLIEILTDK